MKKYSASETSKLEEKLDGLVTLLTSANQAGPGIVISNYINTHTEASDLVNHDVSHSSAASFVCGGHRNYLSLPNVGVFSVPGFTPAASSSVRSTPVKLQRPLLPRNFQINQEDAELYLNKFRASFVKHLPFVVIPSSMTSQKLREERPILWVCIMTVASNKSTQQIALSNEARAIIGREAFVEGTRDMDLLLGILVYATW
jgi:hypothetical protein